MWCSTLKGDFADMAFLKLYKWKHSENDNNNKKQRIVDPFYIVIFECLDQFVINEVSLYSWDESLVHLTQNSKLISPAKTFFDVLHHICNLTLEIQTVLTGGNWQKWKRVFLTCPCHEIYRDEAVGLKSCKNTWKITIFVKMWNLGQYRENWIFCQLLLN